MRGSLAAVGKELKTFNDSSSAPRKYGFSLYKSLHFCVSPGPAQEGAACPWRQQSPQLLQWAVGCCLPAAGNVFWVRSFPLPSAHIPAKCSVRSNVQNVSCAPGRWKMHYRAIRRGIWNFFPLGALRRSSVFAEEC